MLKFLYKNKDFVIVVKPVGVVSEDSGGGLVSLIRTELAASDVYPIHRLDRDVGGVMVYALNKKAAAELSRTVAENRMEKVYLAMTSAVPSEDSATLCDLLFKDSKKNKSFVVKRERKGVKYAELEYVTLCKMGERALVRVTLHTGRSHQIRVQFSSRGMPLVGDRKYGFSGEEREIALFSHKISFEYKGEQMSFSEIPSFAEGLLEK